MAGRGSAVLGARVGALDGVRGLALVAVLGYHALPSTVHGGFLGVEMFFVLSGFLLTSLLLDEHAREGRVDHVAYAGRRVRRLVPAGAVVLGALLVVVPLIAGEDAHRLGADLLWSAFGATNWHLIADGASYFDTVGRPPFVRHLWSLAIEIQFYVVCSVLAVWLARRSRRISTVVLGGAIVLSNAWMWMQYRSPDPSRAYFGTDTRIGALLAGVLLALVVGNAPRLVAWSRRLVVPAAIGLVALVALTGETARWLYPGGFLLTQLATAVLIAGSLSPGPAADALGARPLTWLGRRSYGIYLWHWPLVVLVRPGVDVGWTPVVAAAVTITTATVLGALSFRLVELPVIRGLTMPRPILRPATAAAALVVVAMVGLGLRLPTSDPIADSIAAGERLLAEQAVPPPPPSTPTPVAEPEPTQAPAQPAPAVVPRQAAAAAAPAPAPVPPPPPPPVPAPLPPNTVKATAIGDSVMVGGAPALKAKLGDSSYIDAAKSRQFRAGIDVARDLKAKGLAGDVVIIHLGSNGPVRNEELDAMHHEFNSVRALLFVTVRVNKGWQDGNNEVIRAASRHHNVKVVDWHAHSEVHRDWFQSDGTHLRPAGAEAYATLIAGSIPPPPTPTPEPTPVPTPPPPSSPPGGGGGGTPPAPTPTPGSLVDDLFD